LKVEKNKAEFIQNRSETNYFYQFNALRFFAALLVLVGHAEALRVSEGGESLHSFDFFNNGQHAVTFFFVLSGFLITFLLLKERNKTKTVQVKSFYWKRIVRIWPLYFLLIFIGLVLQPISIDLLNLPYEMPYSWQESSLLFITFLPGIITFYFGNHLLEPLWSIGVEEWFYLIWGPLLKYVPKDLWKWILFLLFLKLGLNYFASLQIFPPVIAYIIRMMRFEALFIGGLFACTFFFASNLQNKLSKIRLVVLLISMLSCFLIIFNGSFFDQLLLKIGVEDKSLNLFICSIFFGLLIWSIAWKNKKTKFLDAPFMDYLGEISYGIYMYHLVVITIVWDVLQPLNLEFKLETLLYHLFGIAFTISLAALSKTYFENPILKLKNRFSN
jgi:peptidoglycan/LPS O-acetylase OafA/YrhL